MGSTEKQLKMKLERLGKVREEKERIAELRKAIRDEKKKIRQANKESGNQLLMKAGDRLRSFAGASIKNMANQNKKKTGVSQLFEMPKAMVKKKKSVDIFRGVF